MFDKELDFSINVYIYWYIWTAGYASCFCTRIPSFSDILLLDSTAHEGKVRNNDHHGYHPNGH